MESSSHANQCNEDSIGIILWVFTAIILPVKDPSAANGIRPSQPIMAMSTPFLSAATSQN